MRRPGAAAGQGAEASLRRQVVIGVVVIAVVAAAGVLGPRLVDRAADGPQGEVAAFLAAWERFDATAMAAFVDDPPPDLATVVESMRDALAVRSARFRVTDLSEDGRGWVATVSADLDLGGLGPWSYETQVELRRVSDRWRVAWVPSLIHPGLGAGQRFGQSRSWPPRAPILAADGSALASAAEVILVGVQPGRVVDRAGLQAALRQHLGLDPAAVAAALDGPGVQPDHFVEVARLRPERFTQLRPVLDPVPGVFFRRGTGRVAVSESLAAHALGRTGEVTAERLQELGSPYLVGDEVGLSGLEGAFERQLAGSPSGEVLAVEVATGRNVRTLQQFPGTPAQPLRTTLDRRIQDAADAALAGVTQPAALVALDAASGDVRAVVSRPLDQPFNRALAGQYPPGSTFKVVTAAALLGAGIRADTPVACPAETVAGGQRFVNFEGGSLGATTLRSAFAQSCNTAFVALAADLPNGALAASARRFGFGATYDPGLPAAGGKFPDPRDAAERASAAIGQGRVLASPLHMASVAGAVASGTWRPPRLVAGGGAGQEVALDQAVAATLRELTAEVVRTGTGTAAATAGAPVGGKTGTAETGDPQRSHAWFIGYRGQLAFAVVVEGGGVGGRVAAPLAARFLAGAGPGAGP